MLDAGSKKELLGTANWGETEAHKLIVGDDAALRVDLLQTIVQVGRLSVHFALGPCSA